MLDAIPAAATVDDVRAVYVRPTAVVAGDARVRAQALAEPRSVVYDTIAGMSCLRSVMGAERVVLDSYYWRRRQYYATAGSQKRVEFINGEVVVHAPASEKHERAVREITSIVGMGAARTRTPGTASDELRPVAMTGNLYEPDMWFGWDSRLRAMPPDQLDLPPPNFTAEVLSPETEAVDRGVKFEDYAAHGVQEYWIVDPDAEVVEQYVLDGRRYALVQVIDDGLVASTLMPDVLVPVRALFDEDRDMTTLRWHLRHVVATGTKQAEMFAPILEVLDAKARGDRQ